MSLRLPTRLLFAALIALQAALAQQTVAPSTEPMGAPRGGTWSDYNVVDSFETGYRFRTLGGSLDQYRSTINYGDGVRLLSSFLTLNSKDGHGRFFDEIVLTTQGLGNDPYENATLRIQKNALYRYDLVWRRNDYFNPGLRTDGAGGRHLLDTEYTTQEQDLTLFPQSNLKFFLGYSRGNQNGPALSSISLFNSPNTNDFPLFENVRRLRNEYRFGNEFRLFGVRVNWMYGWEDFKEDSNYLSGANPGDNPASPVSLSAFQRQEPYHGTSPYWRVALFTERKYFAANGRFSYTSGRRAFVLDETALGGVGLAQDRQVVAFGDAQRPVLTGNLTLSFFPTSKLTIVNHTAVNNIRIDGNSTFAQFDNFSQSLGYLTFEFLGIRTIGNETDLNLQASSWLSLFGGYHYVDRLIRSTEESNTQGNIFNATSRQSNRLNSGVFGLRLRPVKPLVVLLDAEIGRADHPLTPLADRNYHALGARVQYKLKQFQFSAATHADYNANSVSFSSYSSHARDYSADVNWTPRDWFALNAGYSKLHLETLGGIAYFLNAQFLRGEQSFYLSNLHAGNLTARFGITKRVDLFAGYSHTQDTGDGRSTLLGPPTSSSLPALEAAQTFPLRFLSPMARISVSISEKIRWNVGYQYYGYNERFYNALDYRAHTGYTSVLWSF